MAGQCWGPKTNGPSRANTDFSDEISEIIERAQQIPKACIFATFDYYPSKPS